MSYSAIVSIEKQFQIPSKISGVSVAIEFNLKIHSSVDGVCRR